MGESLGKKPNVKKVDVWMSPFLPVTSFTRFHEVSMRLAKGVMRGIVFHCDARTALQLLEAIRIAGL